MLQTIDLDSKSDSDSPSNIFILKQNELYLTNCGTDFINGTYFRTDENTYSRHCTHPSQACITIEINKLNTKSAKNKTHIYSSNKKTDEYEYQDIFCIPPSIINNTNILYLISSIKPNIHYYILCIHPSSITWIEIAGLQPFPTIKPINNLPHFFNYSFNLHSMENKNRELTKVSSIHSHFEKYADIHSSWIILHQGLKSGRCLKIEYDSGHTVWELLREIADMNDISPWMIRLKHMQAFVHQFWHLSLNEISMNAMIAAMPFYENEHLIGYYSSYTSQYSYQSKYLKCNENIQMLDKYINEQKEEEVEDRKSDVFLKEEDDETFLPMYEPIDDKYKVERILEINSFQAMRVWNIHKLYVHFGNDCYVVFLEDCCMFCKCWSDDVGGCRIAYVLEHVLNVECEKQGWIVNDCIVDYFDESVAKEVWNCYLSDDDICHLTVFKKK